jgi:hypothetical protein
MIVAFMSLFVMEGYHLSETEPDFLPKVRDIGALAESRLANYLHTNGIGANSIRTVVKAMRDLLDHGVLNDMIRDHLDLVDNRNVVEHLPPRTDLQFAFVCDPGVCV